MIIDKSVYPWLLNRMYKDTCHMNVYGQYPLGIRFHLGIIDNHDEMKMAYYSNDEFYIDDYMKVKISTKRLREDMKTGTFLYEQNEGNEIENCTPIVGLIETVKYPINDHWEYLRTDTFWGNRGRKVFGFNGHAYFPEENHSKVLFWNFVYQEFVMKYRIKTKRPTSTINQDDDILAINIPYEGTNREVLIVTSTKDKYRNHTEALKDAKIFIESGDCMPKVLYK
tara:strand:+ start:333 stop:1007 length:675 start_codon:yes stop_codon:yes gene_type:complete